MKRDPFYVYILCDPRPRKRNEPFYVGKGSKRRIRHWRNARTNGNKAFRDRVARIERSGYEPRVLIVATDLDEQTALLVESVCIWLFGRSIEGGSLTNQTFSSSRLRLLWLDEVASTSADSRQSTARRRTS